MWASGVANWRTEAADRHRQNLLKDPPILILDEATSALDSVTERRSSTP